MLRPFLIFSQSDYLIQIVDKNSHTKWQAVKIQISWLLQKPTDLDLHCLQRQDISGFSRTRVKKKKILHKKNLLWVLLSHNLFCFCFIFPQSTHGIRIILFRDAAHIAYIHVEAKISIQATFFDLSSDFYM